MLRNIVLSALWITISGVHLSAHAGQYATGAAYGRRLEQALGEYQVALTRPALILALQDPNPQVRAIAASKLLVNDRALDTIPLVEAAIVKEPSPRARIRMAFALAQVNDSAGFSMLANACDDAHLDMIDRVEAARYSLDLGRESCLGAITEALQYLDGASNSREVALSLAPGFKHLSDADSQRLLAIVTSNLTDSGSVIRIAASHALSALGKASAIPALEAAIRSEKDDAVRGQMQADLKSLLEQRSKGSR